MAKLLIFAHRGEAQTFLQKSGYKKLHHLGFDGLFFRGEDFLLIGGEGIESSHKLAMALGRFSGVQKVINLGVAGGLLPTVHKSNVYSIRTIYGSSGNEVQFKSYTTDCPHAEMDLISADKRILESTSHLDNFAPLVDREAWHLANVCRLAKKPFYAYKVVSDMVGKEVCKEEVCKNVLEQSEEYSQLLFEHYCKLAPETFSSPNRGNFSLDQFNSSIFYFTSSMKKRLNSLLKHLERKGMSPTKIANAAYEDVDESSEVKIMSAKKRGQWLLERLEEMAWPQDSHIKKEIDNVLAAVSRQKNVTVSYDKNLEDPTLHINAEVRSTDNVNDLIGGLQKLDVRKFRRLLGEEGVQSDIY